VTDEKKPDKKDIEARLAAALDRYYKRHGHGPPLGEWADRAPRMSQKSPRWRRYGKQS
jgi:hypothetical protein